MSDRNEPLYTAQPKHRVVRRQSNQDAASLLSNFQRERGQFQSFTRRQTVAVVAEAAAEQVAAASLVEVMPSEVKDSAALTQAKPSTLIEAKAISRLDLKPAARMNIAVFSPVGGSGKSTMIAALGSILCQQGKRVLLLDASPWQSIAFHFGASETKTGRRTFFAPGSKEKAITLLASGEDDESLFSLSSSLVSNVDELTAEAPFDCALFDLSGTTGERLLAFLRQCEIVLIPLLPAYSAIRSVATVRKILEPLGSAPPRMRFILNSMDDSTTAREVLELLNDSLGDELFPSFILHQPEVRKALAEGIVLPSFAPKAQATVVFEELAQWLLKPDNAASMARKWSEG